MIKKINKLKKQIEQLENKKIPDDVVGFQKRYDRICKLIRKKEKLEFI